MEMGLWGERAVLAMTRLPQAARQKRHRGPSRSKPKSPDTVKRTNGDNPMFAGRSGKVESASPREPSLRTARERAIKQMAVTSLVGRPGTGRKGCSGNTGGACLRQVRTPRYRRTTWLKGPKGPARGHHCRRSPVPTWDSGRDGGRHTHTLIVEGGF